MSRRARNGRGRLVCVFAAEDLPFFETADQNYLVLKHSAARSGVYAATGRNVTGTLVEFVRRLLFEASDFYLLPL